MHLGPKETYVLGARAVYAFFLLSGYIVTYILDTNYFHMQRGVLKFYLNRVLRIYPTYWVVILLTLPLTIYAPNIARGTNGDMGMATDAISAIKNTIIFGMAPFFHKMDYDYFVPQAWSLAVELTWWFFIPFIIRRRSTLLAFFLIAFSYRMLVLILAYGYHYHDLAFEYFSPFAAMLPFSLGTLIYFCKKRGFANLSSKLWFLVIPLLAVYFIVPMDFSLRLCLNAGIIYYLSGISTSQIPIWLKRVDNFLGNLSYPIFLVHLFVAVVIKSIFPAMHYPSTEFLLLVIAASNVLAFVLFYSIEVPVNKLRSEIKC